MSVDPNKFMEKRSGKRNGLQVQGRWRQQEMIEIDVEEYSAV